MFQAGWWVGLVPFADGTREDTMISLSVRYTVGIWDDGLRNRRVGNGRIFGCFGLVTLYSNGERSLLPRIEEKTLTQLRKCRTYFELWMSHQTRNDNMHTLYMSQRGRPMAVPVSVLQAAAGATGHDAYTHIHTRSIEWHVCVSQLNPGSCARARGGFFFRSGLPDWRLGVGFGADGSTQVG